MPHWVFIKIQLNVSRTKELHVLTCDLTCPFWRTYIKQKWDKVWKSYELPCFRKHENWVSKSAERKRLLNMVVHGKDKVETRILLCPCTVVYKSAHWQHNIDYNARMFLLFLADLLNFSLEKELDQKSTWKELSVPSCNLSSCFKVTITDLSQSICNMQV